MTNYFKYILIILIISACKKPIDPPPKNNISFFLDDYHYDMSAKALRTRKHKTISLKISSTSNNDNIVLSLIIDKYTDAFTYKTLPDSNIFWHEDVQFILIVKNYYESVDGKIIIYEDNDKYIKGSFNCKLINPFDIDDKISITSGEFDIKYSKSVAIIEKY